MQRLAFVDLETTGVSTISDRIIEIGIVSWDENGWNEWSQLINPQGRVPEFIESLTGITSNMIEHAPTFEDLADEIWQRLDNRLFVAHNARFDYGFLKHEFKRLGYDFRTPVLCTVKLSRKLYPGYARHNLDSLAERHGLAVSDRHRALGDARVISKFWETVKQDFPQEMLKQTVTHLLSRPSLPPHLESSLLDEIPETTGVYIFYADNDLPLYIGKSKNVRQRVLTHFSSDHSSGKEMSLSQQLKRIEWTVCAGELEALLTEVTLIKSLLPTHNRRLRKNNELCSWKIDPALNPIRPELVFARDLDFATQSSLYGLFKNQKNALEALSAIACEHQLCPSLLGLEKTSAGKPCFAYQIKRCKGACIGQESETKHKARLIQALHDLKLETWPYPGAIGIREKQSLHVIDHWCYLGTAKDESEIWQLLEQGRPNFDRDAYNILRKWITYKNLAIVPLSQSQLMPRRSRLRTMDSDMI